MYLVYAEESGSGQTVHALSLCGRQRVWTDCSCTWFMRKKAGLDRLFIYLVYAEESGSRQSVCVLVIM